MKFKLLLKVLVGVVMVTKSVSGRANPWAQDSRSCEEQQCSE
ncbi:MAG: hypothetical protein WBQ03_07925 [Candidatus Sulfotelmatobacter sp.]